MQQKDIFFFWTIMNAMLFQCHAMPCQCHVMPLHAKQQKKQKISNEKKQRPAPSTTPGASFTPLLPPITSNGGLVTRVICHQKVIRSFSGLQHPPPSRITENGGEFLCFEYDKEKTH